MSKPWKHAISSSKKWGGKPEDYIKIHDWFDQTKAMVPDVRHRAILHSAFGIFLCEQVFGHNIKNSDNRTVSVRDIGEQHVLEDLGTIPTMQDWLSGLKIEPWMSKPNKKVEELDLFDPNEEVKNVPIDLTKIKPITMPLQPSYPIAPWQPGTGTPQFPKPFEVVD